MWDQDDWADLDSTVFKADQLECLLLLLEGGNRYDCDVLNFSRQKHQVWVQCAEVVPASFTTEKIRLKTS